MGVRSLVSGKEELAGGVDREAPEKATGGLLTAFVGDDLSKKNASLMRLMAASAPSVETARTCRVHGWGNPRSYCICFVVF